MIDDFLLKLLEILLKHDDRKELVEHEVSLQLYLLEDFQAHLEDFFSELLALIVEDLELLVVATCSHLLYVVKLHALERLVEVVGEEHYEFVIDTLRKVLKFIAQRIPLIPPHHKAIKLVVRAIVIVVAVVVCDGESADDGALAELQAISLLTINGVANIVFAVGDEVDLLGSILLISNHVRLLELTRL